MKVRMTAIAAAAVLALFSTSAFAQDHSRGWEQGNIVAVTEVHVKDGMFNAYVNDLNNVWRKFMERQMEDGLVLDYGMFGNPNSREGEPDLYLTVTYKNWAAFDEGVEYFERIGSEIMGSMEGMREAGVERGELRDIGSTYVLRELTFMDD